MPDGWREKIRELFPGELEYWFPDWRQFYEPVRPLAEAGKRALTWGQPKVTKPLQPWEAAEAAGPGPYPVSDYPEPPYEPEPGWEWRKVSYKEGIPVAPYWERFNKLGQSLAEAGEATWGARPPLSEEELIRLQQAPEWARIELAREAAAAGRAPETLTPWQRAQLEETQRQWKARELARPENWIERWFYENMPRQREAVEAGPIWERGAPSGTLAPYTLAPTTGGVTYVAPGQELEQVFAPSIAAYGSRLPGELEERALAGAPVTTVRWGVPEAPEAAYRPTTPPAPPGLSTFVPSLTAGKPITKEAALTLSGQQAQQIPWSIWKMLQGYLGWAGVPGQAASLEDYRHRLEAMIPQAQARRPSWGRTRSYI